MNREIQDLVKKQIEDKMKRENDSIRKFVKERLLPKSHSCCVDEFLLFNRDKIRIENWPCYELGGYRKDIQNKKFFYEDTLFLISFLNEVVEMW